MLITYSSPINTESASSVVRSFDDLMWSEEECENFSRDGLTAHDLQAEFADNIICLQQAVLMLRESADEVGSQESIRDCAVLAGIALKWIVESFGNASGLSDLMLLQLRQDGCHTFSRDESSTDLLPGLDTEITCLSQAVETGIALTRVAYALGNL